MVENANYIFEDSMDAGLLSVGLLLYFIYAALLLRNLRVIPQITTINDVTTATKTCTPQRALVFIKTHKTGSTTLQTIVNRFGFFHNLSFIFNKQSVNNGHFYFLSLTPRSRKLFLPPLNVQVGDYNNYNYDILAVHVRYNRVAMDRFMREGAKYITIIREPSAQWESAFDHFMFQEAFDTVADIPKEEWLETFLEKPSYYREKLRHMLYEHALGRRWYYAQNSQMYDLGLDTSSSTFYDESVINATIRSLEREFDLILIAEYFDESLLILKKQFCWEYEDIVYLSKNRRVSRRTIPNDVRKKIRSWNYADFLLYNHFNNTFWRKVKEYGPKFQQDLSYFRELNYQIFQKCGMTKATLLKMGKRVYEHIEFSPKKTASLFCQTIAEDKQTLFKRVFDRQNPYKIFHVYK